jgi:hypothetical protein
MKVSFCFFKSLHWLVSKNLWLKIILKYLNYNFVKILFFDRPRGKGTPLPPYPPPDAHEYEIYHVNSLQMVSQGSLGVHLGSETSLLWELSKKRTSNFVSKFFEGDIQLVTFNSMLTNTTRTKLWPVFWFFVHFKSTWYFFERNKVTESVLLRLKNTLIFIHSAV